MEGHTKQMQMEVMDLSYTTGGGSICLIVILTINLFYFLGPVEL